MSSNGSGLTWSDIQETVNITYRQLDTWIRAGLIHPAGGVVGTGNFRYFTPDEVNVLATMADLVSAGLMPAAAAGLARQLADVDVGTMGKFNVSKAEPT
jgi:MerR HTH family regulatory protein